MGSPAHGGFSWRYSDIDIAVITEAGLSTLTLDRVRGEAIALSADLGSRLSVFWTDRHFSRGRFPPLDRVDQNQPRLTDLCEQERIDRVEFVVGNTLFILLHELSHVHFSEMHLPVLGREEDEADTFATLTLLKVGTSPSERLLANASQGWFLSDMRDQQTRAKPLYYDEHDLSPQRAYQMSA